MNTIAMGKSLCLSALIAFAGVSASPASAADFRFVEGAGFMDLLNGDVPVYRHVTPVFNPAKHAETFKVFHHVNGFHGEGFLTKGVGGEFTHHRGLFLGWSVTTTAGKTMDSWHGGNGSSIRHSKYLPERELKVERARRASVSEWTERDGTVLVRDTREITAWFPEAGRLYMDWSITIASASGDSVKLNGDPQHAGFQFRADSLITAFEYLGPADKTGTGDVWTMKNANSWAVNKFALKGHGYAVMQMDHPTNPRPVVVSHRDYGRFGHYFTATIPKDKPLTFYFRTMVLDTDKSPSLTQAAAQALYDEYAKADPSVSIAVPGRSALSEGNGDRSGRLVITGSRQGGIDARDAAGIPAWDAFSLQGRRASPGTRIAPGAFILREAAK
jgi:hypothetical protein